MVIVYVRGSLYMLRISEWSLYMLGVIVYVRGSLYMLGGK